MSWRLILGLPFAGAVVMALFLWMSGIISVDDFVPGTPTTIQPPVIPEPPDEPEVERREVKPPTEIKPPPPPETEIEITIDPPTGIGPNVVGPPVTPPVSPGLPSLAGDPTPIVRVDPRNFERCFDSSSGQEERVRVVFDIAPDGQTANVEVVSSTDTCFNRSAVRAVEKWRYNPKTENGQAVWWYGVNATIIYQSAD